MIRLLITLLTFFIALIGHSQLVTYSWPIDNGEAILSDKYKVFVQLGNGEEQEIEVLMSNAIYQGDYRDTELKGRTYSFTNVSFNPQNDKLTFRVEKLFGSGTENVKLAPKSYGLTPSLTNNGKTVSFHVDSNNRYLSVNFITDDNQTSNTKWIKHMLCIAIDPLETDLPDTTNANVVFYNESVDANTLKNAKTIYFKSGYHNLRNYKHGGILDSDGHLKIQTSQHVYLEGGAFVEGIFGRNDYNDINQKVYGRGILSGRQYLWTSHPDYQGPYYGEILHLGNNAEVNGVTVMESPMHGIVGRKVTIQNLKFMGWHCNNDGIRIGNGSEVFNSYLRCVDDHFYNFEIYVHDCVLWAGHNGSIMTYGWGGTGGNTYNAGGSTIENVDIINCEWTGLGNNNGLIMSQTGHDFAPRKETVLKDIRIEGSIPGLTNLKPRTSGSSAIIAEKVPSNKIGYLGDLTLENITVEGQFDKGVLKGSLNASTDEPTTYLVQNVEFKNINIAGNQLTVDNYKTFFNVDPKTIYNVTIDNDTIPSEYYIPELVASLKIEAESFTAMEGIQSENTSDKDGGENIGFIQNGDWTSYNVEFTETGTYRLSFRVATGGTGGIIKVSIDDEEIGEVEVLSTESNGWQDWYTTKYIEVDVYKGTKEIKLTFEGESGFLFNLNWFSFELYKTTSSLNIVQSEIQVYPNPVSDKLQIKGHQNDSEFILIQTNGSVILRQPLSENYCTIQLNNIKPGIYIAVVKEGDKSWHTKLVKN